jgi:hypothetical protein
MLKVSPGAIVKRLAASLIVAVAVGGAVAQADPVI